MTPRLPHIVIGGAPRSGTTFLVEMLRKHPDVYIAQPIVPEPKVCLRDLDGGIDAYRAVYDQLFAPAPEGSIRIEKTTNYFENEEARPRLAAVLPDTKLLFILREPVARAYSNWLWSRKNGLETLSFEDAIRAEATRVNPLPHEKRHARPFDYMARGAYGTLAQKWIDTLGADRIGFFLFEESLTAPEAFTEKLLRFIGASPRSWDDLKTGKINATEPDPAGLPPALAQELRAQIKPEVDLLAKLTGLDVSIWGY